VKTYIIKSTILVILSLCIASEAFAYGDFYKGSKRGWFWFEQQERIKSKKEQDINQKSNTENTATEELNQFREELDEAKAAMIMRPNVDNTIKFIRYQNEMFAKADVVTANWQDALLVEPSLNIAREIPISASGAKIKSRSDAEDNKELLKSFAKKFQLLFFYKGSCIYCSHFAEVLEVFANRYGFAVSSVAMDNKEIKKFPSSNRVDLVEKWGVDFVPSVFAYSQELGVAIPISSSFLAIDELEKHAVYAASKLKERLSK
jgi:hypothetical protein